MAKSRREFLRAAVTAIGAVATRTLLALFRGAQNPPDFMKEMILWLDRYLLKE